MERDCNLGQLPPPNSNEVERSLLGCLDKKGR
jgi:hypothetical protein